MIGSRYGPSKHYSTWRTCPRRWPSRRLFTIRPRSVVVKPKNLARSARPGQSVALACCYDVGGAKNGLPAHCPGPGPGPAETPPSSQTSTPIPGYLDRIQAHMGRPSGEARQRVILQLITVICDCHGQRAQHGCSVGGVFTTFSLGGRSLLHPLHITPFIATTSRNYK